MGHQRADISAVPRALADALRTALDHVPATAGQTTTQLELVRSLEDALAARRERIVISQERSPVEVVGPGDPGAVLLVTIAMVHCERGDTAAIAMVLFATAAATSALLIASHARPFTGENSVSPQVLR